jgi:hypothetical protein
VDLSVDNNVSHLNLNCERSCTFSVSHLPWNSHDSMSQQQRANCREMSQSRRRTQPSLSSRWVPSYVGLSVLHEILSCINLVLETPESLVALQASLSLFIIHTAWRNVQNML